MMRLPVRHVVSKLMTFAVVVASAPLLAENLIVNPAFSNDAEFWLLGPSTTLQRVTDGEAYLETLSSGAGGLQQCVALAQDLRRDLRARFRVTPRLNRGGNRGLLTFFPQEACGGTALASSLLEPAVDTTTNPLDVPVDVSGTVTAPVEARSVEFRFLAYALDPSVPYAFSVKDPALEVAGEPPPGMPDLEVRPSSEPTFRVGDEVWLFLQVVNYGEADSMGTWTLTISAPEGVQMSCSDPNLMCSGAGSSELRITSNSIVENRDGAGVNLTILVEATDLVRTDAQQIFRFRVEGGGDSTPSTAEKALGISAARRGVRVEELQPQQVEGRGRAGQGGTK